MKSAFDFKGAITALITPFGADGSVDHAALERLVQRQIEQGIHGLAPCGTTGEGATLSPDEQQQVIETVVRVARGRVPVIAGCGSNDTRRTVESARRAESAGADALLVVTPYYNKPNPSGMHAHYEAIASATHVPIVAYNVPGRTGQDLGVEGALDLARIPGVLAIKEASAKLEQLAEIIERRPAGFLVLSGDDPLALPAMALGADGLISVVSNIAPAETSRLIDGCRGGDYAQARALHYRLLPLMRANFIESNPVPVKAAAALLGLCSGDVRAPLGPPSAATRERIQAALELSGLLEREH